MKEKTYRCKFYVSAISALANAGSSEIRYVITLTAVYSYDSVASINPFWTSTPFGTLELCTPSKDHGFIPGSYMFLDITANDHGSYSLEEIGQKRDQLNLVFKEEWSPKELCGTLKLQITRPELFHFFTLLKSKYTVSIS